MEDINIVEFYRPNKSATTKVAQYELRNMRSLELSGGVAWNADIFRNGVKVGTVENHGDGSSDRFGWDSNVEHYDFHKVAESAYRGKPQFESEEEDALIAWLDIQANYAVSA